jgi:hypothetical protein
MNPFSWVNTRLNQNERFVEKSEKFLQWAVGLLQQNISLQLRAKYNFVTADEAKIGQSNSIIFLIY